jgi:hypothetical protein
MGDKDWELGKPWFAMLIIYKSWRSNDRQLLYPLPAFTMFSAPF